MIEQQAQCFTETLVPALARHGVVLARWEQLDGAQRDECSRYFSTRTCTRPPRSRPWVSIRRIRFKPVVQLGVHVTPAPARPKAPNSGACQDPRPVYRSGSRICVGARVAAGDKLFVSLEDLIRHNAGKLFPGMEIGGDTLFRIYSQRPTSTRRARGGPARGGRGRAA